MNSKTNVTFLSHHLSESTPLYGNGKGISFQFDKNMDHGDSCNTMNLSFPNHSSTHIDFPCHFNNKGKNLNDFPADFWEFSNVDIIDLTGKVSDCQIIGTDLFEGLQDLKTELLIIKTGYEKYRGTDRYTLTPPGLSFELSYYIRKNYPKVRCIGMDLISIGSYANRDEGHKAHHSFLNPSTITISVFFNSFNNSGNFFSFSSFSSVILAHLLDELIITCLDPDFLCK